MFVGSLITCLSLLGVLLADLRSDDLKRTPPPDVLPTNDLRRRFLERFSFCWQDWTFRDVPENVEQRYSEAQKRYFETPPRERHQLLGLSSPWEADLEDSEDENNIPRGHG